MTLPLSQDTTRRFGLLFLFIVITPLLLQGCGASLLKSGDLSALEGQNKYPLSAAVIISNIAGMELRITDKEVSKRSGDGTIGIYLDGSSEVFFTKMFDHVDFINENNFYNPNKYDLIIKFSHVNTFNNINKRDGIVSVGINADIEFRTPTGKIVLQKYVGDSQTIKAEDRHVSTLLSAYISATFNSTRGVFNNISNIVTTHPNPLDNYVLNWARKKKDWKDEPETTDSFSEQITIVIDDEGLVGNKSKEDLDGIIKKLRGLLEKNFKKVEVRKGYINVQPGDIVLKPNRISIKEYSPLSNKIDFDFTIQIGEKNSRISLEGKGRSAFQIGEELLNNVAFGRSLKSLAAKISTHIISSPDYHKFAQSIKMLHTESAELQIDIVFSDAKSLLPNQSIDAGENTSINITLTNQGKGTAFAVNLQNQSNTKGLNFPANLEAGDIQPGESKEITIPVEADLSLESGTSSFLINAREKRGYDSRPIVLQVPTASLQEPGLMIASCNLNDSSGLGQGDGDNQPENNETIELSPYIKNDGVGAGLQVKVELKDVTPGIEVVKGNDDLAVIEPGSLGKATLAFKVPRTFSGSEIKYSVVARDVRGMETSQTYTHAFASSSPQLQYSYQVVDSRNREIPGLENGKSYRVRVIPKNVGNNIAEGVKVHVRANSNKVDIGNYSGEVGSLSPGSQGGTISIPVNLERSFTNRVLELDVAMSQDSFPGFDQKITLPVKVTQPKLDYQVVLLNGVSNDTLSENSQPKFRVSVSNNGSLDAENVEIKFQSSRKGALIDEKQVVGAIKAGESQYKDFTFRVLGGITLGELPIKVKVTQADFDNLDETVSFNITKQTALVQKVAGTVSPGITGKATYSAPPDVYISSPNNNVEVLKETIVLRGSVITFGAGNAVESISIFVNNTPVKVIPVDNEMRLRTDTVAKWSTEENKIVFDGALKLAPEDNEIKIICTDRNNQKSEKVIRVSKKARLGNIYAVVVGISKFHNQKYNLNYAAGDAKKFYNFLLSEKGGALPKDRINLLIDEQANRAAIIKSLEKFLGRATKEDTVEIYLATHGFVDVQGQLYYLTHNTDIDNLRGTGLSNKEFEDIISTNIKAGKIILYLDACHSGKSGLSDMYASRRGIGIESIINKQINGLAAELSKAANGVTSFSASSASGASLEDPKWGGGVFTYSLLKGLNGEANENNDEWVSVGELEKFLTREVLTETGGEQSPKVNGTLLDVTPIAKVR